MEKKTKICGANFPRKAKVCEVGLLALLPPVTHVLHSEVTSNIHPHKNQTNLVISGYIQFKTTMGWDVTKVLESIKKG